MLSLLKKSGAKGAAGEALAWRPNFRDTTHLPDTKTVRTKFFVNAVALSLTICLALALALREAKLAAIKGELAAVEASISEINGANKKALADFAEYKAQEKQFNDANLLLQNAFSYADFTMHMASILPPGVKIRRIDYRGLTAGVNVAGDVRGINAEASNTASEFVKKIQADKVFTAQFGSITLLNLSRNAADGNMTFELVFIFKNAPKKKGAK